MFLLQKKLPKSLTIRTTFNAVFSCVLLGTISLLIGLSLYSTSLLSQHIHHAFETAINASIPAARVEDSELFAKEIMRRYRELTPEQRARMGTEEYRDYFSSITATPKGFNTWDVQVSLLSNFIIDVDDVYLAMYDEETSAMVYIVDPGEEGRLYPGEWEPTAKRSVKKFLNWDGSGMLYDFDNTEKYGWMCTAGFPIRDENGEIFEFLLVDVTVQNIFPAMADYTLKVTAGILIVTLVTAWFSGRYIKKSVAGPIDRIADAAETYVKTKEAGTESLCFSDLKIQTGDELENLSHVMADMEKGLADHEKRIRAISAEQERINTELEMASRIQLSMLPHEFPPFPRIRELDLYATMTPAREVGGDFYDFFLIDEDHLAALIADVSGKGIPAALFMMASKILIQSYAMLCSGAGEILTKINEAVCSNNQTEMFVTVWLGILEISSGRITASNAGHEYPVLERKGQFSLLKKRHGLVIGGMEGVEYEEYTIDLAPGDKLFIYTDGVPEATDADNNMFGLDRMMEALNQNPYTTPEDTLRNVHQAVNEFVAGAEQFDDMTMLCLEYKGAGNPLLTEKDV